MNTGKIENVEAYISQFSSNTKIVLERVRKLILTKVPGCVESISYGMPAYKYKNKPLIYFAGYKKHLGVYALPNTHEYFLPKLKNYKQGKGSVQFPLNQEIPYELIEEMLIHNVNKTSN